MKSLYYISYLALGFAVAGCAGGPSSPPDSNAVAPVTKAPITVAPDIDEAALPKQVAVVPKEVAPITPPQAEVIDVGPYDAALPIEATEQEPFETEEALPVETVFLDVEYEEATPLEAFYDPQYVDVAEVRDIPNAGEPLAFGQMSPIRDDPIDNAPAPAPQPSSGYNIAALKANYRASEALSVAAPAAHVQNTPSSAFGHELSASALSRLNPGVAYVAAYKKIGYPWGDVSEETGVCTDVVIRSYRGLGIDLQSMVHEDMRRAFVAYPSQKIYGLSEADPNIDHRRVVNLEAFFERVGASIPVGSNYQPGDVITWRLSGGEPHIGVVVDRRDPKTGNPLIVHNLGAGVRAEDLLDYAPPHGAYRFAPDQQSRMASLALKQSI